MIFEVTDDQIEQLNDADLRTLVGRLCEEEVRAIGHSPVAVTRGGNQNARDGGIDVRVSLPEGTAITGYVPAAATGFQVKAQNMSRQEILYEMAPEGILRESIVDLASRRGAYIIASSRGSLADTALTDRRSAMLAATERTVSANALIVDFYDRHRMATWVNQHPGLIPWVRERVGRPLAGWRPFGDWSSSPTSTANPFLLDNTVRLVSPSLKASDGLNATDGVNALRRLLEQPKGIVRLVGLSGVGKTRLVQALFDDRIGVNALASSRAIYTDISDSPDPVPLELASHLISLRRRAILVVDNCGAELHRKLAATISSSVGLLSLITIEHDINDDEPENTDIFKLGGPSEGVIEKILEARFPAIAAPSRRVIADFSDSNARMALALAQTAKAGESLVNLRDSELFKRLFEQSKGPNEELLNAAKVCALLYSFDGETLEGEESELALLAPLAGLTVDQLYAHVAELVRRQLIQRRSKWRAILPQAIAHRLAKLALQDIPFSRIEDVIINGGSERMLRSFSKRMGYLHDNDHALALVTKWFGEQGLLSPVGHLNNLGQALLNNVAPIDPAATLAFIETAAARHSWFFESQNTNRSQIVRILRSIAYDPALFERAVVLIKNFATHQDTDGNDAASEVLKSLCLLYLSGSHASAAQRAAFIRNLLESANEADTEVGLILLDAMFDCGPFSSHYSFEFGARLRDFGSTPSQTGDFLEWFGQAARTAAAVGASTCSVAPQVRKTFAKNFSEVCRCIGMVDELVSVAETFVERYGWPEGWVAVRSTIRKGKTLFEPPDLAKLEALARKLQPTALRDLIRTYAFSKEWESLDIADAEDEEGSHSAEAREKVYNVCTGLGRQLSQNRQQLQALLPEILTAESQKTFWVGKGIAAGCESVVECWSLLVEEYVAVPEHKRRQFLLGGFINEAMRRDLSGTDALLDGLLANHRMHPDLLYCQVSAGVNEKGFSRLMSALKIDSVPVASYASLAYGRAHEGLSDEQVLRLSQEVLRRAGGAKVAVEIVGMRIFGLPSGTQQMSQALKAAGRRVLEELRLEETGWHADHLVSVMIDGSLDAPEDEELGRSVCRRVFQVIRDNRLHAWDIADTIAALTRSFPRAVLDIFVERDEPDPYGNSRAIFSDLRMNHPCPLDAMPEHIWLGWAQEKPESRYIRLAQTVKFSDAKDDDKSSAWSPAAQRIIDAAPEPQKVLKSFLERFGPMSWSGSRAVILASRRPLIETLKSHSRPEVAEWATQSAPEFERIIERERAYEAQGDRNRDERFE